MHIQMSAKRLAEARGWGGCGGGGGGQGRGREQYFIKSFSMHVNRKKWTVLPKFRVELHFIWKHCFHNINDGSLEVHSNKNCVIY